MRTQNLTTKEMQDINGGATSDNSLSYGAGASVGADSLLTLSSESHNGDRSTKSELAIGKGLNFNIFGLGNNSSF